MTATRLARLAREQPVLERCELCGAPLPSGHRHLMELSSRELMCACRACSTLFDRGAAGGTHFRLVPDRRLRLDDLELSDELWEELRLPVDIAFLFHHSGEGRVMAYYPGPMGATESLLTLEAWETLEAANPALATMEPDVEALLVNRTQGARQAWLVPMDECFTLVGVIRTHWKGLTGGGDVWRELATFFTALDRRSNRKEITR